MKDKVLSMKEAVGRCVHDGDVVYMGGFIQHEPFAAAHEMIRQGKRDITLSLCAGLVLADQLIGAGMIRRLITTFTWNPLPAPAHCFVRAVQEGAPRGIELEEYSILALNLAYFAGAMGLPYVAAKTMMGSDFDQERSASGLTNRLKFSESPFTGERVCLIPPLRHDVGIIQVQQCDAEGNSQMWGMLGVSRYGMQSCDRIIVCTEEIVQPDAVMRDPNRTCIPAFRVDAVVEEPWGGHPAPLAGCYDMDWPYYAHYEARTRNPEGYQRFLEKWVYGVENRAEYLRLLGRQRLEKLRPEPFFSDSVSYGRFSRLFEA
jgi:glutaconate CoA-transferase subunit A